MIMIMIMMTMEIRIIMLSRFKVADIGIANDTFVPRVKPSTQGVIPFIDMDKDNDEEDVDVEGKKVKNVYLRMQWKKW